MNTGEVLSLPQELRRKYKGLGNLGTSHLDHNAICGSYNANFLQTFSIADYIVRATIKNGPINSCLAILVEQLALMCCSGGTVNIWSPISCRSWQIIFNLGRVYLHHSKSAIQLQDPFPCDWQGKRSTGSNDELLDKCAWLDVWRGC